MNFSTTARRMAQGLFVLCLTLVTAVKSSAQCSDFVAFPPSPVTINLTLDAFGDAQITNAVLNANGFVKNGACDFWLSNDPNPNNLAAYNNTPINFTCNPPPASAIGGVGTYTLHVRVGGLPLIGDDMGPGATIVDITVNVFDNIFPTILTAPGPFVRNADALPAGSCRYTIQPGDVVDFDPVTFGDNCLSTTVQYRIDGGAWITGTSVVGQQLNGSGSHTIQWQIIDASGNTTVGTAFNVTVIDATAPSITCPGPINVNTNPLNCVAAVTTAASATDNCGATLSWSSTTFSASPGLPILDNTCSDDNNTGVGLGDIASTVAVSGVGVLGGAGKHLAGVKVVIQHTFRSDLQLALVAPDGVTTVLLANNVDGGGDNFFVNFRDDAALLVNDGAACGVSSNCTSLGTMMTVRPQTSNLAFFNGVNADGNWTLRVCDRLALDIGVLKYWSLQFENSSTPSSGSGGLTGVNFPLGSTTVTYLALDNAGNASTCTNVVTVTDVQPPTITCPASLTVNAAGSPICNYTVIGTGLNAVASDNCTLMPGQPVVTSPVALVGALSLDLATFGVGSTSACPIQM